MFYGFGTDAIVGFTVISGLIILIAVALWRWGDPRWANNILMAFLLLWAAFLLAGFR